MSTQSPAIFHKYQFELCTNVWSEVVFLKMEAELMQTDMMMMMVMEEEGRGGGVDGGGGLVRVGACGSGFGAVAQPPPSPPPSL